MSNHFRRRLAELTEPAASPEAKAITQAQRDDLDDSDFGDVAGRKFPIRNQSDLDSAAHLIGKASNPEAVKKRIIKIAKRKGLTLPPAWQNETPGSKALGEFAVVRPDAETVDLFNRPFVDETLVYYGGEVKALGEGKVGGYLVRFGSPEDHDVQGDYFTAETQYGRAIKSGADIIYHHGLVRRNDALAVKLGNRPIGDGALKPLADGIWIEGMLNTSDIDVKAVYDQAAAGQLGWSSGTTERLVRRTAVKSGVARIDQWPIIEASLSPTPVDPRNRAVCLKALIEDTPEDVAVPAPSFVDRSARLVSDLGELCEVARGFVKLGHTKQDAIKALIDAVAAFEPLKIDLQRLLKPDPEAIRLFRLALERDAL